MIQFCRRFVVPRIRIVRVPKGPRGTIASAGLIANLIREGARDFYVRQRRSRFFERRARRPRTAGRRWCALFNWVRNNIRYTRDIFRTELLHTARRMLELRAGDCDDMTILLGAMLISNRTSGSAGVGGFPRRRKPHAYSHIYPEVMSTENGSRSTRQ